MVTRNKKLLNEKLKVGRAHFGLFAALSFFKQSMKKAIILSMATRLLKCTHISC